MLAPGWIDTHTHLDANQFWDPFLTPCSRYGVTTVVLANCGYALAPAHDARAARVRDRSARDGRAGAARRDRRGGARSTGPTTRATSTRSTGSSTALNRAFLVGHLPVRAAVMGPEAARTRVATADEIARDCRARGRRAAARRARLLDRPGRRQHRARQLGAPRPGLRRRRAAGGRPRARRRARAGPVHDGAARAAARPRAAPRRPRMARAARRRERQAGRDRAGVRHLRRARRRPRPARRDGRRAGTRAPSRRPGVAAPVRALDPARRARRAGARAADAERGREGGRRRRACATSPHDPDAMDRLREEGAQHPAEPDLQRPLGSRARAVLAAQRRSPRPRPRHDRRRAAATIRSTC